MERRPKRAINKPPRYMTTSSSDEAPKRKKIAPNNTKEGEIEEDIEELRTILEEDSAMDENNTLFNNELVTQTQHLSPQTQYLPSQTHTHTHVTYTNTPSYTNLDIYSNKTHNTCATTYTSHSSAHNYTPHVQNDILNHSATFSEFQDNAEQFRSSTHPQNAHQDKICDNLIHRGRRIENPMYSKTEEKDNRRIHERLDGIEAEFKRMNTLLQSILKCVQIRNRPSRKPTIFPIASLEEMDNFENIDEDAYSDVVNYFRYIGGFNLKEAINLYLKESLEDSLTPSFTWFGREGDQRALYNARLTIAIYEATCNNQHFEKPTRSEFQVQMREALRAAKERYRHRLRAQRMQATNTRNRRQDFWSDEQPETIRTEHTED